MPPALKMQQLQRRYCTPTGAVRLCWSYGEVPDRPRDRSGASVPLGDSVVRGSSAVSRKRAGNRRQFRAGAAAQRRVAGEAADGAAVIYERRPHAADRSEEHTSELQSRQYLVCRLLLEKNTQTKNRHTQ